MKPTQTKPSIVFCHGIWADGSCFNKLIPTLQDRERPRKPSVAASRVLASARASSLPSAARTQPVAGWSLWLQETYLPTSSGSA
jgi:hypothetical protein